MGLLVEEPVIHRREYPEIETNNSEVIVNYRDGRGTCRQKRIALVGLAAFVLNCVNESNAKDK